MDDLHHAADSLPPGEREHRQGVLGCLELWGHQHAHVQYVSAWNRFGQMSASVRVTRQQRTRHRRNVFNVLTLRPVSNIKPDIYLWPSLMVTKIMTPLLTEILKKLWAKCSSSSHFTSPWIDPRNRWIFHSMNLGISQTVFSLCPGWL